MTLQDIVKILNLNPVFKNASDNEKVTAINQYLNNVSEIILYDSTPNYFANKPVKFSTETYKLVQDVLKETLLGEDVEYLIKYSLLDYSLENPYEAEFLTVIEDDNYLFSLNFDSEYRLITPITFGNMPNYEDVPTEQLFSIFFKPTFKIGLPNKIEFPIQIVPTYKLGTPQSSTQTFQIQPIPVYKITDSNQISTFGIEFSATYLVW